MHPDFRGLGLALMATIAVGAGFLPTAAKAAPLFEAEATAAGIHGLGARAGHEHYFRFPNQVGGFVTLSCGTAAAGFSKSEFPTNTLTITPAYSKCTLGGESAFEPSSECSYQFVMVPGSSPPTAVLNVLCPTGKEMTFESPKCTVHIPPQTSLQHVVFTSTSPGLPSQRDVDATISISALEYKLTPGCPGVSTTETKKTGTFTEEWTLVGTSEAGVVKGLWVK